MVIGLDLNKRMKAYKRSSFFNLNRYILSDTKDGKQKVEYANCVNIPFCDQSNLQQAADIMTMTADQNNRAKNKVRHLMLTWKEGETPTPEQVDRAVQITLREMNLCENECLYSLHKNTDNYHVHISVNSIHPDTHKAIQPNKNWTIYGMEKAACWIEYEQGWQINGEKRHHKIENGKCVYIANDLDTEDKKIQKRIKDKEIRTGEKSAIRLAQEVLLPLINQAQSWEQLHYRLAVKGCEYMTKGSGAVIKIGDTFIKASQINKKCSLSNLEKRFGTFKPKDKKIVLNKELADVHISEPIKAAEKNEDWEMYNVQRLEYKQIKKKARQAFNENVKEQRNQLYLKQKEERDYCLNGDWKGKGRIRNAFRSVLAAKQAIERQNLNDAIKEQRKLFNERYGSFPTFEEWLKEQDKYADAEIWRYKEHYTYEPNIMSGSANNYVNPEFQDIRGFEAIANNELGIVDFIDMKNPTQVAFTDRGKTITVENMEEKTLLAGLQLAQQKWGKVKLTGSNEYINKCIEIAAKNNIKISNPELQEKYAIAKENEEKMRRQAPIQKQIDNFRIYESAVQADRIKVTATQFFEDGGRRGFMVNDKDGYHDGYDPQSVEDHMNRIVNLQRSGRNIYYTPISADTYHILVDDLTAETVMEMREDGYSPAIIIESSPGNYQAILNVDKIGTEHDREIGNRLAKELNKKYGDPKESGEIHAHRAPGFDNKKPKHKKEDGTYPDIKIIEARGGQCKKCAMHIMEIKNQIENEKANRPKMNITAAQNIDTAGAYKAHFDQILDMQKKKGMETKDMDASRIDSMIAIRLRATGHSYESVFNTLVDMAPTARKIIGSKGNHNWPNYAERTLDWAFGSYGDMQIAKFERAIPRWKTIEEPNIKQPERTARTSDDYSR